LRSISNRCRESLFVGDRGGVFSPLLIALVVDVVVVCLSSLRRLLDIGVLLLSVVTCNGPLLLLTFELNCGVYVDVNSTGRIYLDANVRSDNVGSYVDVVAAAADERCVLLGRAVYALVYADDGAV
jgi:hypothetical protein